MIFTTSTGIITQQVLNETTGELETKNYREERKYANIKGGFSMVYKDYDELLEEVIKSNMDMKIFQVIKKSFTYKRVEVVLSSTDISKQLNVSKPKVTRFIKNLINNDFLKRVGRSTYRMNPFMFIPFKSNGSDLQQEWKRLENV
jgi:DNA-binding transcriptional regulator GbsR (MarR family)